MKRLILTAILLQIMTASSCQKKEDNTIIIDTAISLNSLKMILFKNGYTLSNSDSLFISTEPKQVNGATMVKLDILRIDSTIILKGRLKSLVEMQLGGVTIKEDYMQIRWVKPNIMRKGSIMVEAWNEMEKIAKILGSKRSYQKQ